MTLSDAYARVLNWAGPDQLAQIFVAAVALLVAAWILLALGYFRVFARAAGVTGVLLLMGMLLILHDQTTVEQASPEVRITRAKYHEDARFLMRVGLVALPAGAALVMGAVLVETWRRRRARVPALLSRSLQMYHQQLYDGALAGLDEVLRYAPDQGDAYFHRGRVHQARGDLVRALADFERAIETHPESPAPYVYRGRILTQEGRLDDALENFERADALRPNDPETVLGRGVCFARRGAITHAVGDFQRVLRLTNHTDYTVPAGEYLRLYGATQEAPALPNGAPLPEEPPAPEWVI